MMRPPIQETCGGEGPTEFSGCQSAEEMAQVQYEVSEEGMLSGQKGPITESDKTECGMGPMLQPVRDVNLFNAVLGGNLVFFSFFFF